MKQKLPVLLLAILLPVMVISQSSRINSALSATDDELFMKHIYTHSILLQTMQAALEKKADISDEEAIKLVDEKLKELNDDYEVERKHALKDVIVTVLSENIFMEFMRLKGKVGGQHKFPRVLKGKMLEDWQKFLKNSLAVTDYAVARH